MGIKIMKGAELLISFVLISLLSCSCDKSPTDDGNNNHYDPRNVSRRGGNDIVPSIVVDNMGVVHIVWSDVLDLWYSYKTSGGDWSEPLNITNTPSPEKESTVPALAVDNSNNLHLVWREGDFSIPTFIYHSMKSPDSSWTTPIKISEEDGDIPSIGVDGVDNVHVVWWDGTVVYRMKIANGIWNPIERVQMDGCNLSMAVSRNGAVHVVADGGGGGFVRIYYTMKPFGGSWTEAARISENSTVDAYYPEIALSEDGSTYVSWKESTQLRFRIRNPNGTWIEIDSIPDVEGFPSGSTVDVDDKGIYFVWEAYTEEHGYEIYYSARYSDDSWSELSNISSTLGASFFNRHGSFLKDGLLHITWQDETPGNWDIFYTVIDTR